LFLWKRTHCTVVIQTWSWLGKFSSRVAGSRHRALAFDFSVRIWYMFLISKCRGESDLGLCMSSVLAKECHCVVATSNLQTCLAAEFVGSRIMDTLQNIVIWMRFKILLQKSTRSSCWLSAPSWLSSTTANRHLAPTWWVGGVSENPFRKIVSFSEWLREDVFRHWCSAWERRLASCRCVRRGKCRSMQIRVLKIERTSPPHVNLTAYIRGELRPTTLSKEFVAVCGLRKMVQLINHKLNQKVGWWEKKRRKTEEDLGGNFHETQGLLEHVTAGRRPVRKGCGAQPKTNWWFFVNFLKKNWSSNLKTAFLEIRIFKKPGVTWPGDPTIRGRLNER